jgi:DNA-directed RNA polymerase subunit K/omega
LDEIGRRALHIRDIGNKRVDLKNALAELAGDAVREIKQDHINEKI